MYAELRQVTEQLTGPGGPFEVVTVAVDGIDLRAYKAAPPDLRAVWQLSAAHGDADYLVYGDERLTYAEAHRQVAALAANLGERFGVGPGDRVAIAMRNYPEWILAYWATVSLGAAVVGLNAWWTEPELRYGLHDSAPKVVIVDQERLDRLDAHRGKVDAAHIVAVRTDPETPAVDTVAWADLVSGTATLPEVSIDPDSDACIFYTSGTTGRPKGAQLTHRGCVNNIVSLAYWQTASTMAMQLAGRGRPADETDAPAAAMSALVATPLFHVTACNCILHPATLSGGKLALMYKWDALEALKLIEAERATHFSGVPVMSRELISHPRFDEFDTSTLRAVGGGGAPLQPDLVGKIDQRIERARPGTGYGMTETCGVITMNSADFFVDRPATAGPLLPVFEGRIVDPEGNDVPPGEPGELWVRSSQVIRGYLNRPEATAETITDGWLHTGDIATLDPDGFVSIVDRAKDMVLRGGENIYCAEVEAALFEHPAVAECAVFGVPDDRLGEEVGAAVVLTAGASLDAGELRAHLAEHIARFKVPRYLWIRTEELPRNASGKFLKRALRERLAVADAV